MRTNGHKQRVIARQRPRKVIVLSRADAEAQVKRVLGVRSMARVHDVLESGKLRGTAAEAQARGVLFLLGATH